MKEFTKAAIADTFMELLQEHTIDHITVKDLAEKCGINRQTFYYHFADIYDLMEWTLDNELKKFLERYDKTDADWKEQLQQLFVFSVFVDSRSYMPTIRRTVFIMSSLFTGRCCPPSTN